MSDTAIAGVRLGVARAGIKSGAKNADRDDLTLIELAPGSRVAGVFTQNAFCAAPVQIARAHLAASDHAPRYLLVNTGNANAGTGQPGLAAARATCAAVAERAGVDPEAVLPFSTGVIGELLPVERITAGLDVAFADLSADGWARAAGAILTTDTRPKLASRSVDLAGGQVRITGMAKGAGMLCPNMATMLAYVATDAAIATEVLNDLLRDAVAASFNRISVDGDTSTNDAAVLIATGASGVAVGAGREDARDDAHDGAAAHDADRALFGEALTGLCIELAQGLVRDGEGASKFVTLEVVGGRTVAECDAVAYTIAHSPLVKTALFASDPNWGRLLAAIGRAGLLDLVVEDVALYIGDTLIAEGGARAASYTEAAGVAAMAGAEIRIRVELNRGDAASTVWTSDLSYDYVRINAEYRT